MNQRVVLSKLDPLAEPTANVSLDEVAIPKPGTGETVVKVILRPVNPVDTLSIQGKFEAFAPVTFPCVPGFEGVAEVVESATFRKGQRVVGKPWAPGTWQTYFVMPDENLEPVPDDVTDVQAASFWVNPMSVVGMLRILSVPKGEFLLQTAAGSALGRQIIQVGKSYGIKTISVVRRSEQKQELLDLGADLVIATDKDEVEAEVAKITGGKGAYGGIDAVGGTLSSTLLNSIREGGTLLVYGFLSGHTVTVRTEDLMFGQKIVRGFLLTSSFWVPLDAAGRSEALKEVFTLFSSGVITDYKGKTYPLMDVKAAIAESLKTARGGKIYLSN